VHHVARQLERKLTNELDHDELVSAGTLGLMAAMNSFDPSAGSRSARSRFRAFAARFSTSCAGRTTCRAPFAARRATSAPRAALAREALSHARRFRSRRMLGVDVQTLWKWESDVEGAIRVPIDRPVNDRGEGHSSPLDLLHTDA
jgi:RNA polymerase sigma factor for flagellar operon FliA